MYVYVYESLCMYVHACMYVCIYVCIRVVTGVGPLADLADCTVKDFLMFLYSMDPGITPGINRICGKLFLS